MASDFGYRLTDRARSDLDSIVSYIAAQLDNPQAAAALLDKLQAAVGEVCAFPESGALVVNEFLPYKMIRKKLVGNYMLYYFSKQDERMVFILRILYGRRNLDEILREMESF